jgi:transposase
VFPTAENLSSAAFCGFCRGAQKPFIRPSTRRGADPARKPGKPHLTHCRSIYYICIYQIFSLLLRHEKGLRHGIEKGHRGVPGETHPKTQAAPSGNGARRGSRLHGARGETSRADPCRRCLEPQSCPQDEEIEKLKARIAELEGGAKPVAKTGANSSVPPSRNPIGVPHTRSQRKPSGRKTGWQRGHQGGTRPQSGDVTGTERWYPAAVCPVCGKPLDMESATIAATRQVVDIPLPIMAAVTGHLQMRVKCSCGHCCKGRFPENVNAPVSFGHNIMAPASYLSTYQNVPFKRLTHLFETIFGLHVSEGTVSNMLNTMNRISKKPYEMIRRKVAAGKVAGAEPRGCTSPSSTWRPATAARTSAFRRRRTAA